jgi:peptidyl-tRNA hydrolase
MTTQHTPDQDITGHTDQERPWVMQLVIRIDKTNPTARTAVCQAAATAVATLLTDPRATSGQWAPAFAAWTGGRIRKHARRARTAAAWDKTADLPGVTVATAAAAVRALVPTPVDEIPAEVAKLQLSGSELPDPDARAVIEPDPDGPVVISISPEPFLPLGKAAAAAGHAAQLALATMDTTRHLRWAQAGFPVSVEHPEPGRWAALTGQAPVRIVDAGLTVVDPGTTTAIARWA